MKNILVLAILLTCSASLADFYKDPIKVSCTLNKMRDYTYFEEGFTPQEYPDIDVRQSKLGEWAVQYGCHQPYTTESGYEVAVEVKANKTIVKSVSKFGDIVLTEIAWDLGVGEAVVRVKEEGRARFRILGFATCQMPTSR